MTTAKRGIFGAIALCFAITVHTFAVDGLKIAVQGTDVALNWPSTSGQTFLILYTKSLNTPIQWTVLATGYQAADGTNQTTYIDSGRIPLAPSGGGSMIARSMQSSTLLANQPPTPLVMPADASGSAVPLALYPPGFDLSKLLILDPATSQWVSGAGYIAAAPSVTAFTANGTTPLGGPVPLDGGSGGAPDSTTAPDCGFYEVMGVTITGGITNGVVSDFIQSITAKPEIGVQYLQLLADGQPFPNQDTLVPPFTNAIAFQSVDTTRLSNGPHTIQVEAVYKVQNLASGGLNHVLSQPFQVDVFNELSFPTWDDMTEDLVCNFDIVSAHPVVNWEIDIYNIFDYMAWLNGQMLNIYPIHVQNGSTTNGIIQYDWNLIDDYGNPRNDPNNDPYFVSFTYTEWSGSSLSPGTAHPNAGGNAATGNPIQKQPAKWPPLGNWVVSWQDMFRHLYDRNNRLHTAFSSILGMANLQDAPPFWQGPIGGTNAQTFPIRYYYNSFRTDLNPTNANFYQSTIYDQWLLQRMLLDSRARNFFYSGHGSPDWICTSIYGRLLNDYGMHRYRFVWLDGCETGNGVWPNTFGIHGPGLFSIDYYKERTKRPGLFVGNKYSVPIGNIYDTPQVIGGATYDGEIARSLPEFYNQFIFYWALVGEQYKDAVNDAQNLVKGAYPSSFMTYPSGPKAGQRYWPGDDQVRVGLEEMQYNSYNYDSDIPRP